jgi:hypothetical protein
MIAPLLFSSSVLFVLCLFCFVWFGLLCFDSFPSFLLMVEIRDWQVVCVSHRAFDRKLLRVGALWKPGPIDDLNRLYTKYGWFKVLFNHTKLRH